MTTATPIPGWYADPHGQAPLRYWDGSTWTSHTAALPEQAGLPEQPAPSEKADNPDAPGDTGAVETPEGAAVTAPAAPVSPPPPAPAADPWGVGVAPMPAFAGADPYLGRSAPYARGAMPWWAWAIIAVATVGVIALLVYGAVIAFQAGTASESDREAELIAQKTESPEVEEEPDDFDYFNATGTETWRTPQGLATFDVHRSWRDDFDTVLENTPDLEADFAGSWNLDGYSFEDTWDYMYVWEFGNVPTPGLTIEEASEEFYSSLLYLEDIHVISHTTETFETAGGYEVWREDLSFIDSEGYSRNMTTFVTSNGRDWLIFDVTESQGDAYEAELMDMLDSVVFLSD